MRFRLPLLITVLLTVMLTTFLWAAYREAEITLVDAGHDRADEAAEQLAAALSPAVENARRQVAALADEPAVRAFLLDRNEQNRKALAPLLAAEARSAVRRTELWDASGSLLLETSSPLPDSIAGLRNFPAGDRPAGTGISPLRRVGAFPYFDIVVEIPDTAVGRPPIGYLRRFGRLTASSSLVKNLVGDEAMLRVGTIGQAVWTDMAVLVPPPPRAEDDGRAGEYRAGDGSRLLGASAVIHQSPWIVWVGFPRSLILAPAQRFIERMTLIAVLFILVSSLIAVMLSRYLTRPLHTLVDATERIASGDYSRPVIIPRRDEIGRLGQAFNTMRREIEDVYSALKTSHDQIHFALASARIGVWEIDLRHNHVRCTDSMALVHGVPVHALPQTCEAFLELIHPDDRDSVDRLLQPNGQERGIMEVEYRALRADGTIAWVEGKTQLTSNEAGTPATVLGVSIDITERRRLESQLRQAQKMDAIGQLAGGVAHDFNNLLTAIVGHGNLLLSELSEQNDLRGDVIEILKAGESAAGLTRQLLAFSRQQVVHAVVLDVNAVVEHTQKLLTRLIGEHIKLETELTRDAVNVRLDASQLQQALVNLAVNARDAMPDGGTLRITTRAVQASEVFVREHLSVKPGRYALLTVTDTGVGMDADTQARLFEPFFTTKPVGKGTGLGLSTVFGIVKQSGGHIYVYSEPGHGARFSIYLPASPEAPASTTLTAAIPEISGGDETILIVEDDDAVRALASTVLKRLGYRLLIAANAEEALQLVDGTDAIPDLLLTDVIMPGMSGPDLFRQLAQRFRNMRVVFTSGYAGDSLTALGIEQAGAAFIEKPYSPASLATKVREALG